MLNPLSRRQNRTILETLDLSQDGIEFLHINFMKNAAWWKCSNYCGECRGIRKGT